MRKDNNGKLNVAEVMFVWALFIIMGVLILIVLKMF